MAKSKKKADADEAILDRLDRISNLLATMSPEVLGQRVKRLREAQTLSIREIAEKASISKNSVVRLEQGRGTQAVTVLKVCSALGVHIERLAEPQQQDVIAVVHRKKDDRWFDADDMGSKPLLNVQRPLTRDERKKAVDQGAKTPVNLLRSRLPGGAVLPSVLEISEKSPLRSHVGEEFAYILQGEAIITVGQKKYKLKEGESITFWSAEPHSYQPADLSKVPVRILSVRVDG